MSDSWTEDLEKSMGYIQKNKVFLANFMRMCNNELRGDSTDNSVQLIPCEGSAEEIAKFLDKTCGIDYIVLTNNGNLAQGVGCRFQPDKPDKYHKRYCTFTVRKDRDSGSLTECEKRKLAIANGGLYPYWTLHAYVEATTGKIDRIAIAKTEELIDYCLTCNPYVTHTRPTEHGQASFYVVDWFKYNKSGRFIRYLLDIMEILNSKNLLQKNSRQSI